MTSQIVVHIIDSRVNGVDTVHIILDKCSLVKGHFCDGDKGKVFFSGCIPVDRVSKQVSIVVIERYWNVEGWFLSIITVLKGDFGCHEKRIVLNLDDLEFKGEGF